MAAVQAIDTKSGEMTQAPESSQKPHSEGSSRDAADSKASIPERLTALGSLTMQKGQGVLDRIIPPEKQGPLLQRIKDFVAANPKLSAFFAMHLVMSGIPVVLFVLFAISTFVVSLLVALIASVLAATFFTLMAIAAALLVVGPTLFVTTFAATWLFFLGLFAVFVSKRMNGGTMPQPPDRKTIGDKVNQITNSGINGVQAGSQAISEKLNQLQGNGINGAHGTEI